MVSTFFYKLKFYIFFVIKNYKIKLNFVTKNLLRLLFNFNFIAYLNLPVSQLNFSILYNSIFHFVFIIDLIKYYFENKI